MLNLQHVQFKWSVSGEVTNRGVINEPVGDIQVGGEGYVAGGEEGAPGLGHLGAVLLVEGPSVRQESRGKEHISHQPVYHNRNPSASFSPVSSPSLLPSSVEINHHHIHRQCYCFVARGPPPHHDDHHSSLDHHQHNCHTCNKDLYHMFPCETHQFYSSNKHHFNMFIVQ